MNIKQIDFFLPFEFDQVPKNWDPWEDSWKKNEGKLYIWKCFEKPPFDGILISKSKFDDNINKIQGNKKGKDLKTILNLPKGIKIFGDCGAFQYRDEKIPPYRAKEILDYYQDYGFDMGCSIDHIIINKKDKKLRKERYNITQVFAKKCLELYENENYSFELFGVAQGWDIKSYSDMVEYLHDLGYENICIGGLVGVIKKKITHPNDLTVGNLIKKLAQQFKKYKKVHIFGRGNLELFELYQKSGVTQFDNNIMRKAWTDEKKSYHLFDKGKNEMNYYTSMRIPLIKNKQGIHQKEIEIFKSLEQLSNKSISNDAFIKELKKYYAVYNTHKKMEKKIGRIKEFDVNDALIMSLLKDEPWNKCQCDICKKYKIHVCVFRRRMRNTLRAFHNVYNYYLYLKYFRTSKIPSINETTLTDFT